MDQRRLSKALFALTRLLPRLRGPDGCPWDAHQTDSTIKMYLLEEAYEVLDAVERGTPEDVCQELGDLLFQILFLARLAEERGEYGLVNVMEGITEKMINRHPHVFGDKQAKTPEEVSENWMRIKKSEEKGPKRPSSQLQSIPINLPALLRAHRLIDRASRLVMVQDSEEDTWERAEQKFKEIKTLKTDQNQKRLGEALGEFLFYLVDLARSQGLNAEDLLRDMNRRFIDRVDSVEGEL